MGILLITPSVLASILFSRLHLGSHTALVIMSTLKTVLPRTVSYFSYVDDIQVSFKSCNLSICERQTQLSVNRLVTRAEKTVLSLTVIKVLLLSFLGYAVFNLFLVSR